MTVKLLLLYCIVVFVASFTDDTDNSDEDVEQVEELDFSDNQSLADQSKIVTSDTEAKPKEETKSEESNAEKSPIDVVEMKVQYESSSSMDSLEQEVESNKHDNVETVMPNIEPEPELLKSEENKPTECTMLDITDRIKTTDQEELDIKMPEIQEMKVTVVKIVPEIQEEKKEEDAVDVPKESDDSVEIKQNEELSTLDRYEFKDEEEEIYLPEWKAERHVDEEWKPKSEEKRGRPRKNQNKDKVETKKETPKEKKEVKKGKMTMAERKYMGQIPPQMAEMEPPSKKLKEEEVMEKVEVKEIEVNGDDTEEDNETEKKKVKKKTKKKETLDSDSSDMDHKKVLKKDTKTPNKPVTKSKKRLKDSDDLEKRSLMSDDDSSVTSEKCETDNLPILSEVACSFSVISSETQISADNNTIEISQQTETATGAFENTPPTSPEQEMEACVNICREHSHDSHKNIVTSTEQTYESPVGNASPSSNDGSVGSGNIAGSDSSDMVVNLGKRRKDSEEGTPAKKKKRGKSKSIGEKKSKPNGKIEIFIKYLQCVFIPSPTKLRGDI